VPAPRNRKHILVLSTPTVENYPDACVRGLVDSHRAAIIRATRELRSNLRNPPYTSDQLLASLAEAQLPQTVTALRPWTSSL